MAATAKKTAPAGKGKGDAEGDEAPAKKGKKKLVIIALAVLLVAGGGGGYVFLTSGSSAEAAAPEEEEVPLGEVITADPISINLAESHYLKIGLGLQAVEAPEHAPDPALALDAAIELFSGRSITELSDPATRDGLKAELVKTLDHDYHGDVVDVYFTQFVMQ
jgi:flagellar FliL protein